MPRPARRSHSPVLIFVAVLMAALLFGLVQNRGQAESAGVGAAVESSLPLSPSLVERDRERIRTHLARVEMQLRSVDPAELAPRQAQNRLRHLDVLHEYLERGEFPRNLHHPGELVPYFVDDRGVHCAVGYLMHRDGRDDLVRRIAEHRNNATIAELSDDPELVAWLADAGLSAGEAARIQPMYCGLWTQNDPNTYYCPPPPEPQATISARYGAASMAAAALGGLSVGLTLAGEPDSRSRWVGAVGTASGVAGLGLGAYGLAEGGNERTLGALSTAVGLLSTYVGVRTLLDDPRPGSGRPGFEDGDDEARGTRVSQVTVVPLLSPVPMEGPRAGLAVHIRR